MTSEPHTEMHDDHRRWLADLAMWQDDLAFWGRAIAAVTADLDRAATALTEYQQALSCHGAQLREDHERITYHEEVIAKYDRGQPTSGVLRAVEEHAKEEERHARLRNAHERIKRQHHMILAKLSLLLKAFADPT